MRTTSIVSRLACLAGLLAVLTACGFHPRNALNLPPELNPFRVVAPDPYSPLAESLADAIQRAGAQPSTDPLQPATTLQILSERWGNTPISIDELGRAQEFSLRYAVAFTLVDAQGGQVVPQQVVELSRDYVAPPADSIGKTSERELLAREMRREMSASILRRIGAALQVTRPASRTSPVPAEPAAPAPAEPASAAPAPAAPAPAEPAPTAPAEPAPADPAPATP